MIPRDDFTRRFRAKLTPQQKRDAAIMRVYWDSGMLELTALDARSPASKLAAMEIARRIKQQPHKEAP